MLAPFSNTIFRSKTAEKTIERVYVTFYLLYQWEKIVFQNRIPVNQGFQEAVINGTIRSSFSPENTRSTVHRPQIEAPYGR